MRSKHDSTRTHFNYKLTADQLGWADGDVSLCADKHEFVFQRKAVSISFRASRMRQSVAPGPSQQQQSSTGHEHKGNKEARMKATSPWMPSCGKQAFMLTL